MENFEEGKRAIIWFLWKQGKKPAEILREICGVYGDNAPSKTTVYKWVERFSSGYESVEDEARSGRPATPSTAQVVENVRKALEEDRRLSLRQLEDTLGIARTTLHRIVTDDLGMKRIVARWVPKLLTNEQKQTRVQVCRQLLNAYHDDEGYLDRIVTGDESWFSYYIPETKAQSSEWRIPGEGPPIKAKTVQSAGKRMASVFWDTQGILLIDWLPQGMTITSSYYIEVLQKLRDEIKHKRRGKLTRGILLLHDNARPHTSYETQTAIRGLGFEVMPHPAYSPDLAPSDYHLFAKMKEPLRGKRYNNICGIASAISQWVKVTPEHFFAEGIKKLPERWNKCVHMHGEYVEKFHDE